MYNCDDLTAKVEGIWMNAGWLLNSQNDAVKILQDLAEK